MRRAYQEGVRHYARRNSQSENVADEDMAFCLPSHSSATSYLASRTQPDLVEKYSEHWKTLEKSPLHCLHLFPSPHEAREISQKTGDRLALASMVNWLVRDKLLAAGSGNQRIDIWASQGESYVRSKLARVGAYANRRSPEHPANEIIRLGSGFCEEFADVSMAILRMHERRHPFSKVRATNGTHSFVLIGDLNQESASEIAVVDPWVIYPVAHLLDENKWQSNLQVMGVVTPARARADRRAISLGSQPVLSRYDRGNFTSLFYPNDPAFELPSKGGHLIKLAADEVGKDGFHIFHVKYAFSENSLHPYRIEGQNNPVYFDAIPTEYAKFVDAYGRDQGEEFV